VFIAGGVGALIWVFAFVILTPLIFRSPGRLWWVIVGLLALVAPSIGAAMHAFIIRDPFREWPDGEIRCRKCRYILRGISEPRCPECGERI
jgi:hypothetical protein